MCIVLSCTRDGLGMPGTLMKITGVPCMGQNQPDFTLAVACVALRFASVPAGRRPWPFCRRSAGGTRALPRPRSRDPYLDNVKLIGVLLVVVGHFWTAQRDDQTVAAAYLLLYLFHMPVFVLVAGLLAPKGDLTAPRLQGLAAGLVVPYLIFQTGYEVGEDWLGRNEGFDLLAPPWLMWFLAALVCWRLMAPVLSRIRGAFPVAVTVSLVGGTTTADDLALAQVLGFLPFFVLGLQLRRDDLDRLRAPTLRPLAAAVLLGGAVAAWFAVPHIDMEWLYWRSSYSELGVGLLEGAAIRAALLAVALLLTAAFLALVPGRRFPLTAWGERTMYAYLLHGFPILALTAAGFFEMRVMSSPVGGVFTAAAAVALALALMSDPVRRATQPLVEPRLGRLWRTEAPAWPEEARLERRRTWLRRRPQRVPDHVEHAHRATVDVTESDPRCRVGAAVGLDHPGTKLR